MKLDLPSTTTLKETGAELGFLLDDEYSQRVRIPMEPFGEDFSALDEFPDNLPTVKYPRQPGCKPTGEGNKRGAWAVKTSVKGTSSGRQLGKTVALKDAVCLADIPMVNGASVLEGYVPDTDATIVCRLLDAGADILGKAVCEYSSLSRGSHTSDSGVVHSRRNPGYTSGGSSKGSATLVAVADVDMALGGDEAASIRTPASFSGAVGIKPTHGLIP